MMAVMELPQPNQPDQPDRLSEMIELRGLEIDDEEILRSDLHCRRCGYNLKTQALTGACPECGEGVSESILRPAEPSAFKRVLIKAVDLFAFLTIWYFCTLAGLLIVSALVMVVDYYLPFPAAMREQFSTMGLTMLLLFPMFYAARKIAGAIARD